MMEHKAFQFRYDAFDRELRSILEKALTTSNNEVLIRFIDENLESLVDPYEGEALGPDWKSLIEVHDVHQFGDFALTKYYDPRADIGLGASWEAVQELVSHAVDLKRSPILGDTVGPKDNPFDPGKMGSYFQSPQQVKLHYTCLLNTANSIQSCELNNAVEMLAKAVDQQTGLYVTF